MILSALIWCMLVHLCLSKHPFDAHKHASKVNAYEKEGPTLTQATKMQRKAYICFWCLNSGIWSSLALFSVITFYKYRMSFLKLSWGPNHQKIASTAFAKLSACAGEKIFKERFLQPYEKCSMVWCSLVLLEIYDLWFQAVFSSWWCQCMCRIMCLPLFFTDLGFSRKLLVQNCWGQWVVLQETLGHSLWVNEREEL